jgi:hypothetical protein
MSCSGGFFMTYFNVHFFMLLFLAVLCFKSDLAPNN